MPNVGVEQLKLSQRSNASAHAQTTVDNRCLKFIISAVFVLPLVSRQRRAAAGTRQRVTLLSFPVTCYFNSDVDAAY